jgi:hypothetical protein
MPQPLLLLAAAPVLPLLALAALNPCRCLLRRNCCSLAASAHAAAAACCRRCFQYLLPLCL